MVQRSLRRRRKAGFDVDERIRAVLSWLPESGWTPALDADGTPRTGAQVAELTGLLRYSVGGDRLAGWPPDMRILIGRGIPHPGAQLTLFEQHEGKRYQVTAANTPRRQIQFLEARHRTQATAPEGNPPHGRYLENSHWPSRLEVYGEWEGTGWPGHSQGA